ncbi:MAG: D-2-hydroxyacid dehydrogenase [Ruminococcus sp.]|nr:D-2-hydroxyacid dehydrogenase [Ruminococcus sp.]
MKICILDAETVTRDDVKLDAITGLGEAKVFGFTKNEDIAGAIGDADAVICNKCLITEEVFSACPNLKYVGLFATGYNNIDLKAAARHGAVVCNVPSYSTDAVAQHTFAFILEYYSKISRYIKMTADGGWINYKLFSNFCIPTAELAGRRIGIVGYGSIGRKVAAIARAFGMEVITHTRTPAKVTDGTECVSLEELLRRSDIVSLHCPLTEDNDKMINEQTLRLMKPDALLVNTARGGLIDEPALAAALKGGVIAAACIDALTLEPMREDCPLQGLDNCFITPHVAWAPRETRERLIERVAENLKAWRDGKPINAVN